MTALWGTSLCNGDPLYVSPDTLVMSWNNSCGGEEVLQQHHHHHHHRGAAYEQLSHQSIPNSFQPQHQYPRQPPHAIELHSTAGGPDWTIPSQHGLPNLPPTPVSPYSPLRPLAEDENIPDPHLTGQHGSDWDPETLLVHRQQNPCTPDINQIDSTLDRRQSAPTFSSTDVEPPLLPLTKCKTDLAERCETETKSLNAGRPVRHSPVPGTGRRSSVQHGNLQHHLTRRSSVQSFSHQSNRTRVPHNLVERRYRDNLNHQIESLRLRLPSLRDAQPSPADADEVIALGPRMPSKAIIISTAATYIKDLETERERLLDAMKALQEQVSSLQRLVY